MGFLLRHRASVNFLLFLFLVAILVLLQFHRSLDRDLQFIFVTNLSNESLPIWFPQYEVENTDILRYGMIRKIGRDDIEQRRQHVSEKAADTNTRSAHGLLDQVVPKESRTTTITTDTTTTTNPIVLVGDPEKRGNLNTTSRTTITTNTTTTNPILLVGDPEKRGDLNTTSSNFTTSGTTKTISVHHEDSSSSIQVFVVTAAGKTAYRERYLASHDENYGWHHDFPTLQSYTFDELSSNDTLFSGGVVQSIPKEEVEKGANPRRSWNLLMASFEAIYKYNPNASWYFMAEDDTVVVKSNLEHYVQMRTVQMHKRAMQTKKTAMGSNTTGKDQLDNDDGGPLYMEGKCVFVNKFPFVMGGAGILMNHGLLTKLAPYIKDCRKKFIRGGYGDLRIAKCLYHYKLTTRIKSMCSRQAQDYRFTSASAWWEMSRQFPDARVISIHEKDPTKLRFLNSIIRNLTSMSIDVTYATMVPYLNNYSPSIGPE